jgi:hypothetical protein
MKDVVARGALEGRSLVWVVFLLCFASGCPLHGQPRNPSPQPDGPGAEKAEGTLTSAVSYRLEWQRHYQLQTEMAPDGTADESGTLWLITRAGPGKPELFLTKIDPDGQLSGRYDPKIPLKAMEWIGSLSPAASGHSVGLLASLVSGERDLTFEGAFFVPARADGLGDARRVADRGPQFPTLVAAGPDQFIAAGDQEPLTLLKVDANGALLWRRSFSRKLVLPTVAVGANGNTFVVSQGGSYLMVQMLDPSGRSLRYKRISAKQGAVVADPSGGCSILLSKRSAGKDNTVYLAAFDQKLRETKEAKTPLCGRGGRTYQLICTPRGHLAIGEGPEQQQQVAAEFDKSGRLIWQQGISADFTPFIVPFKFGFYVVRGFVDNGMDIEKYAYPAKQ